MTYDDWKTTPPDYWQTTPRKCGTCVYWMPKEKMCSDGRGKREADDEPCDYWEE